MGAEGFLFGMLLGTIITIPFFFILSLRRLFLYLSKNKSSYRQLSLRSPMLPTLLAAWLLNLSDRIFIERYFSLEDVAVYSIGSKISGVIIILFSAFSLAYSPYFFKIATSSNSNETKDNLAKTNNYILEIFIILCFILCLFSEETIFLLFDKFYHNSLIIIEILIFHSLISVFLGL